MLHRNLKYIIVRRKLSGPTVNNPFPYVGTISSIEAESSKLSVVTIKDGFRKKKRIRGFGVIPSYIIPYGRLREAISVIVQTFALGNALMAYIRIGFAGHVVGTIVFIFYVFVNPCVSVAKIMNVNDLTYQINGAVYEVNKLLGAGFLEKVYENALMIELGSRGLKVESQVQIEVKYKNELVGEYFADIIVNDLVILEIKAVESLKKVHEAQLLNYLKATGFKIGLLINFTYPKAVIKRFVL